MQTSVAMKNASVILLIVQIWISLLSGADGYEILRGANGAPIIDPFDSSTTIEVNTDKTIECKATRAVTWVSELISELNTNVHVESSVDYESSDEINRYRSKLVFDSITTDYVGKYYCVYNTSLKGDHDYDFEVSKFKASSIYIFVDDPDNLLVEQPHPMIIAQQYEPFVIPCKPTSPKVKVELIQEDGEAQIEGLYDPEVGFTVSFTHIEDSGYYDCKVFDSDDHLIQFHVIVNEHSLDKYISPPDITSNSRFFASQDNEFQLTCSVELDSHFLYHLKFFKNGQALETNDYMTISEMQHDENNRQKSTMTLTVAKADESRDKGEYKCVVSDYYKNENSKTAVVTFVDKPMVELNVPKDPIFIDKGKKRATFLIDYKAYPPASFRIYNPHNEAISSDSDVMDRMKYDVIIEDERIKFSVKAPDINDFGEYTILATTAGYNFTATVKLVVSEKPTVSIDDVYVMAGERVEMVCRVVAYPEAEVTWSFIACQDLSLWPSCRRDTTQPQDEVDETAVSQQSSEITQTIDIKFEPPQAGMVRCKAKNRLGSDNHVGMVQIGDLEKPFMISGLDEDQKIAEGDSVRLECGSIIYNYTNELVWEKDGVELTELAVENNTKFSWRKTITWKSISKSDSGVYTCEAVPKDSTALREKLQFVISVSDTEAPRIDPNFNTSVISQSVGDSFSLSCLVTGLPKPSLMWYKDDEIFKADETNSERVSFDTGNSSIHFMVLKPEDAGTYKCVAWSRVGTDMRSVQVEIPSASNVSKGIMIGIMCVILILIFLVMYLCVGSLRKKRLIKELKAAGLANFEEGQLESIDPDVNLDEQADLLPYNKDVEFPREKLKLGKQLGAGAFGVVVKAVAQGILHYEDETTVAVKMVKKQTDNEVMKALVSELKIMIHLGTHLNVVNLLGAVTKNIAKRELMVIVEYCQFGNLQSFLVKHRPYFVDQVKNDKIDPMIMKNDLRWSKNSAYNTYNSDGNPYTTQPGGAVGVVNPSAHMNSKGYLRHSGFQNTTQVDSCNTEATMLSSNGQEDTAMLSNNSEQPLWRSNYGMDYKGPARSVCTSDLVCWGFQVARGMDYLASRKVLHGDLAARNILLCEDNIVKICDFGLARSMYKNDNYKKKGETPLPFKWLALESISDHTFSTYSDVWAFGVVLWELFSLGKVPYTGMEANQNLYYKLRDGYRMEQPAYATGDLYDIMLNCWHAQPESRPLFGELERRLGRFLHESVKDHYLDLNEPYMKANEDNYQTGRPDYLSQLSCPTSEAPKPPLAQEENFYVNSTIDPKNPPLSPDYLSMSPKSGTVRYNTGAARTSDYVRPDSPTITKNLDTSPRNRAKYPNKKPELPEEIPMLRKNDNGALAHDSDEEQPANGYTEMSFSNGRSQPTTSEAEYKNVFNQDNYVNIPANKAVLNPSYITFDSVNERAN